MREHIADDVFAKIGSQVTDFDGDFDTFDFFLPMHDVGDYGDVDDINELIANLGMSTFDQFDLTGDGVIDVDDIIHICLLYTSPSPRDATLSRMPSSA